MANYTLAKTAGEDAVLAATLTRVNAERAAQGQVSFPSITAMLEFYTSAWIDGWRLQNRAVEAAEAKDVYERLSAPNKTTIRTLLGGREPFV